MRTILSAAVLLAVGSTVRADAIADEAGEVAKAVAAHGLKTVAVRTVLDEDTGAPSLAAPAVLTALKRALEAHGVTLAKDGDAVLDIKLKFARDPDTRPAVGAVRWTTELTVRGVKAEMGKPRWVHGDEAIARLCSTPGTLVVPSKTRPEDRTTKLIGSAKQPPPTDAPKVRIELWLKSPDKDEYKAVPVVNGYAKVPARRTYLLLIVSDEKEQDYAGTLCIDGVRYGHWAKDAKERDVQLLVKAGDAVPVRGFYVDSGTSKPLDLVEEVAPYRAPGGDEVGKITLLLYPAFGSKQTVPAEFTLAMAHRSVPRIRTDASRTQPDKFEFEERQVSTKLTAKVELHYGK